MSLAGYDDSASYGFFLPVIVCAPFVCVTRMRRGGGAGGGGAALSLFLLLPSPPGKKKMDAVHCTMEKKAA